MWKVLELKHKLWKSKLSKEEEIKKISSHQGAKKETRREKIKCLWHRDEERESQRIRKSKPWKFMFGSGASWTWGKNLVGVENKRKSEHHRSRVFLACGAHLFALAGWFNIDTYFWRSTLRYRLIFGRERDFCRSLWWYQNASQVFYYYDWNIPRNSMKDSFVFIVKISNIFFFSIFVFLEKTLIFLLWLNVECPMQFLSFMIIYNWNVVHHAFWER